MTVVHLNINGESQEAGVEPFESLLNVLRDKIGLMGPKRGCDYGGCGACTVIVDGNAVYSCMMPAQKVEGKKIETIEGLALEGRLHPLQDAFVRNWAVQCGFCSSGILMSGKALLDSNTNPNEDDVRTALVGNLCRCTGYQKIVEAILEVARDGESLR